MSKKMEKMRWAAEDRIYSSDECLRQDTNELLFLEHELEDMELSDEERRIIDAYVACRESKEDRMGYLLYKAGAEDVKRKIRTRKIVSRLMLTTIAGTGLLVLHAKSENKLEEIKAKLTELCETK